MRSFALAAAAATTLVTSATAIAVTNSTGSPCAQIAALSQQGNTHFNADLALSCLKSVPVQKGDDLMIEGLKTMVE